MRAAGIGLVAAWLRAACVRVPGTRACARRCTRPHLAPRQALPKPSPSPRTLTLPPKPTRSFHWDLPLALQEADGGWAGAAVVPAFAHYAAAAFERYGGRVKHWCEWMGMHGLAGVGVG